MKIEKLLKRLNSLNNEKDKLIKVKEALDSSGVESSELFGVRCCDYFIKVDVKSLKATIRDSISMLESKIKPIQENVDAIEILLESKEGEK